MLRCGQLLLAPAYNPPKRSTSSGHIAQAVRESVNNVQQDAGGSNSEAPTPGPPVEGGINDPGDHQFSIRGAIERSWNGWAEAGFDVIMVVTNASQVLMRVLPLLTWISEELDTLGEVAKAPKPGKK